MYADVWRCTCISACGCVSECVGFLCMWARKERLSLSVSLSIYIYIYMAFIDLAVVQIATHN